MSHEEYDGEVNNVKFAVSLLAGIGGLTALALANARSRASDASPSSDQGRVTEIVSENAPRTETLSQSGAERLRSAIDAAKPGDTIIYRGDLTIGKDVRPHPLFPGEIVYVEGVPTGNARPCLFVDKPISIIIDGNVIVENNYLAFCEIYNTKAYVEVTGNVVTKDYAAVVGDPSAAYAERQPRVAKYFVPLDPRSKTYAYKGTNSLGGFGTSDDSFAKAYLGARNNSADTSKLTIGNYEGKTQFPAHLTHNYRQNWGVHNGMISHDCAAFFIYDSPDHARPASHGSGSTILVRGYVAGFHGVAVQVGLTCDVAGTPSKAAAYVGTGNVISVNVRDCYIGGVYVVNGTHNIVSIPDGEGFGHPLAYNYLPTGDMRWNDPGYAYCEGRQNAYDNLFINSNVREVARKIVDAHNLNRTVAMNVVGESRCYGVSIAVEPKYRADGHRNATALIVGCKIRAPIAVHADNGPFDTGYSRTDTRDDKEQTGAVLATVACEFHTERGFVNMYPMGYILDLGSTVHYASRFRNDTGASNNASLHAAFDIGSASNRGTQAGVACFGTRVFNSKEGNFNAVVMVRGAIRDPFMRIFYDPTPYVSGAQGAYGTEATPVIKTAMKKYHNEGAAGGTAELDKITFVNIANEFVTPARDASAQFTALSDVKFAPSKAAEGLVAYGAVYAPAGLTEVLIGSTGYRVIDNALTVTERVRDALRFMYSTNATIPSFDPAKVRYVHYTQPGGYITNLKVFVEA